VLHWIRPRLLVCLHEEIIDVLHTCWLCDVSGQIVAISAIVLLLLILKNLWLNTLKPQPNQFLSGLRIISLQGFWTGVN